MKTIEQILLTTIESALDTLADSYAKSVVLTNDIKFQSKTITIDTVQGVMRTGQGTRSPVPNFDAIQTPVMLTFQVDANFLQQFLGIVNVYCATTNGIVATATDPDTSTTYSYKLFWNTPIPSGAPYSVDFKSTQDGIARESHNVVLVVLTGAVLSSSAHSLDDRTTYIEIPIVTPVHEWQASNVTYWNAQPSTNRGTSLGPQDGLPQEDPDDYALGYAIRVPNMMIMGYDYFKVGYTTTIDVPTYIELVGASVVEEFQPILAADQPSASIASTLYFEGYAINYSLTFPWIKGNVLHDYFATMLHSAITSTAADIEARFVITSLSISDDATCKIVNLRLSGSPNFEQFSLTLRRV